MSKDQQINDLAAPDLADSCAFTENDAGTCALRDARETQPRSLDVHALSAVRTDLLDMSRRHGTDSPIGHLCENLRQMFDAYAGTQDEGRRAQLEKNIRRQWADLIGLTGGMQ